MYIILSSKFLFFIAKTDLTVGKEIQKRDLLLMLERNVNLMWKKKLF